MADGDDKLKLIVLSLHARLGRLPTEDELIDFVNGDSTTRETIWNKGAVNAEASES